MGYQPIDHAIFSDRLPPAFLNLKTLKLRRVRFRRALQNPSRTVIKFSPSGKTAAFTFLETRKAPKTAVEVSVPAIAFVRDGDPELGYFEIPGAMTTDFDPDRDGVKELAVLNDSTWAAFIPSHGIFAFKLGDTKSFQKWVLSHAELVRLFTLGFRVVDFQGDENVLLLRYHGGLEAGREWSGALAFNTETGEVRRLAPILDRHLEFAQISAINHKAYLLYSGEPWILVETDLVTGEFRVLNLPSSSKQFGGNVDGIARMRLSRDSKSLVLLWQNEKSPRIEETIIDLTQTDPNVDSHTVLDLSTLFRKTPTGKAPGRTKDRDELRTIPLVREIVRSAGLQDFSEKRWVLQFRFPAELSTLEGSTEIPSESFHFVLSHPMGSQYLDWLKVPAMGFELSFSLDLKTAILHWEAGSSGDPRWREAEEHNIHVFDLEWNLPATWPSAPLRRLSWMDGSAWKAKYDVDRREGVSLSELRRTLAQIPANRKLLIRMTTPHSFNEADKRNSTGLQPENGYPVGRSSGFSSGSDRFIVFEGSPGGFQAALSEWQGAEAFTFTILQVSEAVWKEREVPRSTWE